MIRAVLLAIAVTFLGMSVAQAELALPSEVEAGCPAELPTYKAMPNANFTVLDRTNLTKECLAELRKNNGDDKDAPEGDDK